MDSVKISVIVPVYNHEKYIGRCLRSLLRQTITHSEFEIIVINDASTDNTIDAIKPFLQDIILFVRVMRSWSYFNIGAIVYELAAVPLADKLISFNS